MALPVVIATSGALPVTIVAQGGLPVDVVVNAVTLPIASPVAFYSVVRLAGWTGNCLQVTRASDSATLDVGFVGNVVDFQSADSWALGSALTVSKWYDQSGNGNDLVNATPANQPAFTGLNNWNGLRPVSFDGISTGTAKWLAAPSSINRNAVSVYAAMAPRTSFANNGYYDFTDAGFTTSYANVYTATSGVNSNLGGTVRASSQRPRAHVGQISWASGASQIFRVNGAEATLGAGTSQVVNLFTLGRVVAGALYNGLNDFFSVVIYGAGHNSAQMQSVEAALTAATRPTTSFQKRLVYGGSSLIVSYFTTLNQQAPWQGGFGKGSDWETIVMAVGGQSMASEYTNRANYTFFIDPTKLRNVCVIDAPSNDISAQTFADQATAEAYADTLYTSTTVAMVTALKAAGFNGVVVPTCIARGVLTNANFKEYARLRYNLNVVGGAAANGYVVSDRAANAAFDVQADAGNTTYYAADTTHLTTVGYAVMEAIDKAAILAA